jgi:hypothetical protein
MRCQHKVDSEFEAYSANRADALPIELSSQLERAQVKRTRYSRDLSTTLCNIICAMLTKPLYDACDDTLSVYPHRASLKNMPDHGGNRTYDL